MSDLFAPPTKEELAAVASKAPTAKPDMFAPPTSAELEAVKPRDLISPEQALAYGAGQGVLGAGDEITAGAKTAYSKLAGNDPTPWGELYNKKAAVERQAVEDARNQHPGYFYGGMAGSTLGTLAVPGLNVAKGASLLEGVGTAAALGTLQGAGASNNTVSQNPMGLAKDALTGGAVGGATQGVFSKIGGMLEGLSPSALRQTAEDRAVKSVIGNNASAWNKIAGVTSASGGDAERASANISRAGRDILDEPGVLRRGDAPADIAPRLAEARRKYGAQIGDVGDKIDAAGVPVDGKKISDDMLNYASTIPPNEAGKKLQDRITAEAQNFQDAGPMTFKDAAAMKGNFKYKAQDADALVSSQDASNKMRQIINDHMKNAAANVSPETADALQQANSKYSTFKPAADAATTQNIRELKNRFTSPSDLGVGMAVGLGGAVVHGAADPHLLKYAALAAITTMVHKAARTTSSATVARTADQIANAMEASPEFVQKFGSLITDAANRGPAALVSTHALLMQNSPDYQSQFSGSTQ